MVMLADEKLVIALEKAGSLTAITLGIMLAFLPHSIQNPHGYTDRHIVKP